MKKPEITKIDEDIYQCGDCGEYATRPELIKHAKSCVPGESECRRQYYNGKGLAPHLVRRGACFNN